MTWLKIESSAMLLLLLLLTVPSNVSLKLWDLMALRGNVTSGLDNGCEEIDDQEVFDLVEARGLKAERHEVTTGDGYVLTIHRVLGPTYPSKGPVLIAPYLLGSSAGFLWNDRDQSLGYIFSDVGYDVWIVNTRGSAYSLKHIKLSCTRSEYWNFSFDESGLLDIATSMDYVLMTTQRKTLVYVGHSMGCTQAAVLLTRRPEYNKKVSSAIFLAPGINMTNMYDTMFTLFSDLAKIKGIRNGVVLNNNNVFKILGQASSNSYVAREAAVQALETLTGKEDNLYFDKSRIVTYLRYFPRLSSVRTINHFLQIAKSRTFCMYDEGYRGNIIKYNQPVPPEYNLHLVTAPVAIFAAENDVLVRVENLRIMKNFFPSLIGYYELPRAAHMDFLLTVNTKAAMFSKILEISDRSLNQQVYQ